MEWYLSSATGIAESLFLYYTLHVALIKIVDCRGYTLVYTRDCSASSRTTSSRQIYGSRELLMGRTYSCR